DRYEPRGIAHRHRREPGTERARHGGVPARRERARAADEGGARARSAERPPHDADHRRRRGHDGAHGGTSPQAPPRRRPHADGRARAAGPPWHSAPDARAAESRRGGGTGVGAGRAARADDPAGGGAHTLPRLGFHARRSRVRGPAVALPAGGPDVARRYGALGDRRGAAEPARAVVLLARPDVAPPGLGAARRAPLLRSVGYALEGRAVRA